MDMAAGRNVCIEITSVPRSAAAHKTLVRLCGKDPGIASAKRWRKNHRPSRETWRRGGKMWHHQMKSRVPVRIERGAKYTVLATVDVLRELESVRRWVHVTSA